MAGKNSLLTLESKEREIAKLESEISVQRAKLTTARPNNIKQIQQSIVTRKAKVASLRQEVLGVGLDASSSDATQDDAYNGDWQPTVYTYNKQAIFVGRRMSSPEVPFTDEIHPAGVSGAAGNPRAPDSTGILQKERSIPNHNQDMHQSEAGMLTGEKLAFILEAAREVSAVQESTSNSHVTKPMESNAAPGLGQLHAASPIESTVLETASMLTYESQGPTAQGSKWGADRTLNARNHAGIGGSSLTGALGGSKLDSHSDYVAPPGDSEMNPGVPRPRLSMNSPRLHEEVAEILDGALGRHGNVETYKLPHPSALGYSSDDLSPGAKALMIGWRYIRHWRNVHSGTVSSDSYQDSPPSSDEPSLGQVTPISATVINENLGFHPSAFLINPFPNSENPHHNHSKLLPVTSIPSNPSEPIEENSSHGSQPNVDQLPISMEVNSPTLQSHQQANNMPSLALSHSTLNIISPLNAEANVVQREQQAPTSFVPLSIEYAIPSPVTTEDLSGRPLSSDTSAIPSSSGQCLDIQHSVKQSPSTHELPSHAPDAPQSSLPTEENCLNLAPMSDSSLPHSVSGSLPVRRELSTGKIQEFFEIAQCMGVTLVDLDGRHIEPPVTHSQLREDVEMLDVHSPPELSHSHSNKKGEGQVEGRKKHSVSSGRAAGRIVKTQTSEAKKWKRSSNDNQPRGLLDNYFDIEEDDISESETKCKKPVGKKKKEDECEYERCAQLARDEATIKQAKREVADFITSGEKFSKDIKYLLRTVDFFVPKCASICLELSMEILKTTQGTIRCLQHAYTQNSSQNDWTGSMRAWNVTGVPYRPRKAGEQLDNGALHCGCHWENAVFKFYLFKTGQIESRTRKDEPGWSKEGWGTQHFHPRLCELVLGQVQDITTWCLDNIWSRRKNEEGLYMVRRRESDKLQGLIDRLQAHLAVIRESETQEARAMEDAEEFIQQHEEGKARLQEDAPADIE